MTDTASTLLAAARRPTPIRNWSYEPASEYIAARLFEDFGVLDSRRRGVGGEAIVYNVAKMVPNPELRENGGSKDYGMTMVEASPRVIVGYEVRIYSARNGKHFGAIPRSSGTFATLTGACHHAEQKLDLKARQTRKSAAKTGGTYLTDGERRKLPAPAAPAAPAQGWRSIPGFNNRHED